MTTAQLLTLVIPIVVTFVMFAFVISVARRRSNR
jgi:hypothetical protein